jgi:hypothetical protein
MSEPALSINRRARIGLRHPHRPTLDCNPATIEAEITGLTVTESARCIADPVNVHGAVRPTQAPGMHAHRLVRLGLNLR